MAGNMLQMLAHILLFSMLQLIIQFSKLTVTGKAAYWPTIDGSGTPLAG